MRHEADGVVLTGHTDVLVVGANVILADLKTGWLDSDHEQQLRAYAYLALQRDDARSCAKVSAASLLVRSRQADWYHWTREQLNDWWQAFVRQVKDHDTYRPGRHCGHCPRGHECPAKTALLAQGARALAGFSELGPLLTGEQLGQVYDRAKLVVDCAEQALELVRAEVDRRGSPLAIDDQRALSLQEQRRKQIDFRRAWSLLDDYEDLHEACSISKTALEKVIGRHAPYRGKGRAIADVMRRLDEAGAVAETITRQLRCVKHVRSIEGRAAIESGAGGNDAGTDADDDR